MSPNTRLPIVELAEAAKAEVASAIAEIGGDDLGCPVENWHGRGFHKDTAATSDTIDNRGRRSNRDIFHRRRESEANFDLHRQVRVQAIDLKMNMTA
jgi:predicted NAD/FAD-binding protein